MWLDQCRAHGECFMKLTTSYCWIHMNRTPQSRPHYLGGWSAEGISLVSWPGHQPPQDPPCWYRKANPWQVPSLGRLLWLWLKWWSRRAAAPSAGCTPTAGPLGIPWGYACWHLSCEISSIQFSRPVMSDSLRPHEPQHARPPFPSPAPRVYSLMSIESVMPSKHLILCLEMRGDFIFPLATLGGDPGKDAGYRPHGLEKAALSSVLMHGVLCNPRGYRFRATHTECVLGSVTLSTTWVVSSAPPPGWWLVHPATGMWPRASSQLSQADSGLCPHGSLLSQPGSQGPFPLGSASPSAPSPSVYTAPRLVPAPRLVCVCVKSCKVFRDTAGSFLGPTAAQVDGDPRSRFTPQSQGWIPAPNQPGLPGSSDAHPLVRCLG